MRGILELKTRYSRGAGEPAEPRWAAITHSNYISFRTCQLALGPWPPTDARVRAGAVISVSCEVMTMRLPFTGCVALGCDGDAAP